MFDARYKRIFSVENTAGKHVVLCSIVILTKYFAVQRRSPKTKIVDNAFLVGYYPDGFDDVHAYMMQPTNAKDVPGTDTPADAFLSKI